MVLLSLCLLACIEGVASHGWVTKPVPRNVLICDSRGETEWGCKADRETHPPHAGDHPGPPGGNICSGDNDNGISSDARQQMMRPGPIQARYKAGQVAEMRWNVYADHGGWFSYRICLDGSDTEDCFRKNILKNTAGQERNYVTHNAHGEYVTQVKIPGNIACDHCTLSWFWHGDPALEDNIFINCIDISISGSGPARRRRTVSTRRRRSTSTRRRRSSAVRRRRTTTTRRRRTATTRRRRSSSRGGCCKFGGGCGDCGDDGTGWCHLSASNCQTCTGSFDSNGQAPTCASAALQVTNASSIPVNSERKKSFLK